MSSPIRIGIIGLGGYAGSHHDSVLKLEIQGHARLICTCDPQADAFTAQQAAHEFPRRGVKVFADYRAMLDACGHELDLLVVPTSSTPASATRWPTLFTTCSSGPAPIRS
jgi:predicted dehydrogenase